eukprot:Gregarina_sp_Poly_1__825@NODE_1198_length_4803_cov_95_037162_g823_i0_p2_GENE_NODE_1198_length_4803_cov_95_037162_g823_i0NODE_1198_length_4803_cov_95_037162_g823_i0_p2_ORF_typecomplete_len235_score17_28_NODE_1198_length_4803_cov_95_037162_g823_i013422046
MKHLLPFLLLFGLSRCGHKFTRFGFRCSDDCCHSQSECKSGHLDKLDECIAHLNPGCRVYELYNWTISDSAWCTDIRDNSTVYHRRPRSRITAFIPPLDDLQIASDLFITNVNTSCNTLAVQTLQYDAALCQYKIKPQVLNTAVVRHAGISPALGTVNFSQAVWEKLNLTPPYLFRLGASGFQDCRYEDSPALFGTATFQRLIKTPSVPISTKIPSTMKILSDMHCPTSSPFWT